MKTIKVMDSLLYQLVMLLFECPLFCRVSEQQGKNVHDSLKFLQAALHPQSQTVQSLQRLQRL